MITVRKYQKKDYAEVINILQDVSRYLEVEMYHLLFNPSEQNQILFVAEFHGRITGFACIKMEVDHSGRLIGIIQKWGVLQKEIGNGTGTILIDYILKALVTEIKVDSIEIRCSFMMHKSIWKRILEKGFNLSYCALTINSNELAEVYSSQAFTSIQN